MSDYEKTSYLCHVIQARSSGIGFRKELYLPASVWRWIHKTPKLRAYTEAEVRVRCLTEEQAYNLLAAINRNWLKHAVQMALATGLRSGEILKLEWSEIDLNRKIA